MNNETEQVFLINTAPTQSSTPTQRISAVAQPPSTPVNLDNVQDFSQVCRICATITELVMPILSGEGLQNKLASKINKYLPIKVGERDELPLVICYQCANTLLAWHELVKCCVQTNLALHAKIAYNKRKSNPPNNITVISNEIVQDQPQGKYILEFSPAAFIQHLSSHAGQHPSESVVSLYKGNNAQNANRDLTPKPTPAPAPNIVPNCSPTIGDRNTPVPANINTAVLAKIFTPVPVRINPPVSAKIFRPVPFKINPPVSPKIIRPVPVRINFPLPAKINPAVPAKISPAVPPKLNTPIPAKINTPVQVNINKPVPIKISTPLTAKISTSVTAKINTSVRAKIDKVRAQENEFSDHSDTEGFGPLPESVFEAIEDSQDGQESTQPADTTSHAPGAERSQRGSTSSECSDALLNNNNINNCSVVIEPMKIDNRPKRNSATRHRSVINIAVPPENKTLPKTAKVNNKHSTDDNGKNQKTHKCRFCGKEYRAHSSYFYHLKHSHKTKEQHECQVCGTKVSSKSILKQHMTLHTGCYDYECSQCKKRFRSKAGLYIHEQTHGGKKSFSCTQCDTSFRWSTHLARHMARHAAARAHTCGTCGRAFSVRYDLLRHARTHAANCFSCDKCGQQFAQLRYLKVHIAKQHARRSNRLSERPLQT